MDDYSTITKKAISILHDTYHIEDYEPFFILTNLNLMNTISLKRHQTFIYEEPRFSYITRSKIVDNILDIWENSPSKFRYHDNKLISYPIHHPADPVIDIPYYTYICDLLIHKNAVPDKITTIKSKANDRYILYGDLKLDNEYELYNYLNQDKTNKLKLLMKAFSIKEDQEFYLVYTSKRKHRKNIISHYYNRREPLYLMINSTNGLYTKSEYHIPENEIMLILYNMIDKKFIPNTTKNNINNYIPYNTKI